MTQKRRDLEASKLQEEYDKKFRRYEGYIERLEAKAGQLLQVAEGTCGNFSPLILANTLFVKVVLMMKPRVSSINLNIPILLPRYFLE